MSKYNAGDKILLNGTLEVTLLSWPDSDAGPFNYEFSLQDGSTSRGLDYAEIAVVEPLPVKEAAADPAEPFGGPEDLAPVEPVAEPEVPSAEPVIEPSAPADAQPVPEPTGPVSD